VKLFFLNNNDEAIKESTMSFLVPASQGSRVVNIDDRTYIYMELDIFDAWLDFIILALRASKKKGRTNRPVSGYMIG
jgi:hypothetical protein